MSVASLLCGFLMYYVKITEINIPHIISNEWLIIIFIMNGNDCPLCGAYVILELWDMILCLALAGTGCLITDHLIVSAAVLLEVINVFSFFKLK